MLPAVTVFEVLGADCFSPACSAAVELLLEYVVDTEFLVPSF